MSKIKTLVLVLILAFSVFMFGYKLDSAYFFTDEVLYVQAGQEYKRLDYTMNLQHPLLGKYLSALTSGRAQENVTLLRLPFALLGVVSSLLVIVIISRELGYWWGILGSAVYVTLPFLFSTSRAVLLESPMHFFWLLFSYCALGFFTLQQKRLYYLAGMFFGLAMAVKLTSVVLLPALALTYIFAKYVTKSMVYLKAVDVLAFLALAFAVFVAHYAHLVLVSGLVGLEAVARAFKDVILTRNSTGKVHVVDTTLYEKSPWWFYLYYIHQAYGVVRAGVVGGLAALGLNKPTVFSIYWGSLLVTSCVYFQLVSLKNARYLASMELPLVFLLVVALKMLYARYRLIPVVLLLAVVLSPAVYRVVTMQPNSYHGAYLKVARETSNFTNGERLLIFGSVRSAKWYFKGPEDMVVIRKDLEPLKYEFLDFKYILVDVTERLKFPTNILFQHLNAYRDKYTVHQFDNILLYELKAR